MLTVGNAIMYVKALSKKPLAGTFPFSEYILGCFQSILPRFTMRKKQSWIIINNELFRLIYSTEAFPISKPGGLKTLQVESPSLFLEVSSAAWASEVRLSFLAVFVHLRRWELRL